MHFFDRLNVRAVALRFDVVAFDRIGRVEGQDEVLLDSRVFKVVVGLVQPQVSQLLTPADKFFFQSKIDSASKVEMNGAEPGAAPSVG